MERLYNRRWELAFNRDDSVEIIASIQLLLLFFFIVGNKKISSFMRIRAYCYINYTNDHTRRPREFSATYIYSIHIYISIYI